MTVVDVVATFPMLKWQKHCIKHLEGLPGVEVRVVTTRATQATAEWGWTRLARGCAMLRPVPLETTDGPTRPQDEHSQAETPDLVIDLAGRDGSGWGRPADGVPVWRLTTDTGQPLSAALPFAAQWGRPGSVATVHLVDDTGPVVRSAHLAICGKGYRRMLDRVLDIAARLPALGLKEWRTNRRLRPGPAALSPPASTTQILDWLRLSSGALRHLARRLLEAPRVDIWRVGLIDQPIHNFLNGNDVETVRWLTSTEGIRYCADPFCRPDDPNEIWWERFDYGSGLGTLERQRLDTASPTNPISPVRLDVNTHLSYPYMTAIGDTTILIPEMSASGTTRLYRLDAQGRPELLATLAVAGIDPVLFRWQDAYWLGLTDATIDNRSNFCLWHATDLEGPWTPHAANPVKLDVRSARGAGTAFWHDGMLFRPTQDCSWTYGGGITINRVVECTPDHYREEVVRVIRPHRGWATSHGLHTLSACGNRSLIDAKISVLRPAALLAKLRRRFSPRAASKAEASRVPAP